MLSCFDGEYKGINIVKVDVNSYSQFNNYMIKHLYKHVGSDYCLVVQDDGYILNSNAWTDEFLNYDYIGAPWINHHYIPDENKVGNGGFSLRSKKLINLCKDLSISENDNEDVVICQKNSEYLRSQGIKFAPIGLANIFSVEDGIYQNQFGFHGRNTIRINKHLNLNVYNL